MTELSFEFDQAGKIIDCVGKIKDGGNIDRDYAGSGLARLYETARRQLRAGLPSVLILVALGHQAPYRRPASACNGPS